MNILFSLYLQYSRLGLIRQRILIGKEPVLKTGDGRKATARSSRAAVATCLRSSVGRALDLGWLCKEHPRKARAEWYRGGTETLHH